MSVLYGSRGGKNHESWAKTKKASEVKPFDLVIDGRKTWEDIHDAACNVEKWGSEDDEAYTCHKFIAKMKQISEDYPCNKCRSHFDEPGGLKDQISELETMLSAEVDEARDVCILWASKLHASITQRLMQEEGSTVSHVSKKWVRVWADLEHQDLLELASYEKALFVDILKKNKVKLCNFH